MIHNEENVQPFHAGHFVTEGEGGYKYSPHTTDCQHARLCLKLTDIIVSDDRPQAKKPLSGCSCNTAQIRRHSGLVTVAPVIQDDINHTLIKEWWRSVISNHVVFPPLAMAIW